MLELKIVVK